MGAPSKVENSLDLADASPVTPASETPRVRGPSPSSLFFEDTSASPPPPL